MKDVEVMFENAKSYNQDESEIYKNALELQVGDPDRLWRHTADMDIERS